MIDAVKISRSAYPYRVTHAGGREREKRERVERGSGDESGERERERGGERDMEEISEDELVGCGGCCHCCGGCGDDETEEEVSDTKKK